MAIQEADAELLVGAPEWRGITDYEARSVGNDFVVRGYAALFGDAYPVHGGPERGGWNEEIDPGAFAKTLAGKPDVHFLINHEGKSLARTKSGTLTLSTDRKGLLTEARIDRRTQAGRDLEISMERGDLDEMSFGFRTVRQRWSANHELRTLLEVNLDKGDVSVVNNGSNDTTRAWIADLKGAVEKLSLSELIETRGVDDPLAYLRETRAHLDRLIREAAPQERRTLSVSDAEKLIEGRSL